MVYVLFDDGDSKRGVCVVCERAITGGFQIRCDICSGRSDLYGVHVLGSVEVRLTDKYINGYGYEPRLMRSIIT